MYFAHALKMAELHLTMKGHALFGTASEICQYSA
jgi:hypothetical protein